MITTLHIKNIGIIEELTIDLNKGLNVLTGETGAGKTLIIDSLSILSGGRFSKEMIRKGENNSYVEACIYLPNNSSSIDENIIVSREINSNGRNLCKINGRMVTVNELKEFMSKIIEIHGQNDNQTLLDNKYHLKYLDGYIGNKLNQKQEYQNYYNAYLELEKKLKENYGDDKERQRKLDLLKYQYEEIKQAKLKEGEEEDLEDRKKIIVNAEKIADNLKEADNALGNNAIDAISIAIRALEKIEDIDSQYKETANNLKSSYYELQEIAREISSKREDTNFDEEERNIIEERLDIIHDLKRKYGNTISEILQYKQEIKQEIEHIENLETRLTLGAELLVVVHLPHERLEIALEKAVAEGYHQQADARQRQVERQAGHGRRRGDGDDQVAQRHHHEPPHDGSLVVAGFVGNDTADERQQVNRSVESRIDIPRGRFVQAELGGDEQGQDSHHDVETETLAHIGKGRRDQSFGLSFHKLILVLVIFFNKVLFFSLGQR